MALHQSVGRDLRVGTAYGQCRSSWNSRCVVPRATADSPEQNKQVTRTPPPPRRPIDQRSRRPPSRQPRNGFFSDADPNAILYPVKGSLKQDPTKRSSSRYESDFVWNSNWKDAMDYNDSLIEQQQQKKKKREQASEQGDSLPPGAKGTLSLSQVKKDLNDINVDLSEVLMKKKGDDTDRSNIPIVQVVNTNKKNKKEGRDATLQRKTQRESRAWGRSDRYSKKPMAPSRSAAEESALLEDEEESQARYEVLKKELYLWTIGLTAFSFGCTVVFYGRDVGASYGVGALGGFLYLSSLSRSMDSFGTGFGSAGSPRLLIPIILALGYNRYNTLVSESSGLHLELLPMLVGFFTYKVAVVAKQGLELLDDIFDRNKDEV